MSGGERKKKQTRSQCWEEAGSEFYQESYPMDTAESFEVLNRDPKHLATLLPSKQTRAAAATIRVRTNDNRTMRQQTTSRARRDSTVARRTSVAGDTQISMLPDLSENLSNEQTTWEKIMLIKAVPVAMAQKKQMKDDILKEETLRLVGYEQFKWQRRKMLRQLKQRFVDSCEKLEVWRRDLKHIEGNFGTGVVAYFIFIKWLFVLNLLIFCMIFLFVTLPTLLVEIPTSNCTNITDCCSDRYLNNYGDVEFSFLDVVQGTGYLERTVLFYGYYPNEVFEYIAGGARLSYNLPLAYICITLVCFIYSLLAIVKSAARGFKERLIEREGQYYQYCNLVFGGWDFCIRNGKSAEVKHKAIFNEITATLASERLEEERQGRTRNERYKIYTSRVIVNAIVLGILAACGCAIYYVFDYSTKQLKLTTLSRFETLFYQFLPSLSIVFMNMLVPTLFQLLITFENYRPLIVLRLTLIRTVLLRLASLLVFYASLYSKITCEESKTAECVPCNNMPVCWETYVGQQIYKLLLTDFATTLVLTFFVNYPRALIARNSRFKFLRAIGEQSFDLPRHVLDVVYLQTICWFGFFYAPLLSAIAPCVFFLMFYVKKFACMHNSKPSTVLHKASKSQSMFMTVLLLSFVFALLPVAYSIAELTPSLSCGPYRNLLSVWAFVGEELEHTPAWIRTVGFFLSTAGFVIPVFILLLLLLYYYTAVNSANRHMVMVLKNQLVLEGHDKQFLLERLSLFLNQDKHQKRTRHSEALREGDRNISSN